MQREEFVHRSSGYSNGQEDIRKRALAVISLLDCGFKEGSIASRPVDR